MQARTMAVEEAATSSLVFVADPLLTALANPVCVARACASCGMGMRKQGVWVVTTKLCAGCASSNEGGLVGMGLFV